MNIIFVAGLHGNERQPVCALSEHSIDFILGNPKAYSENKRFTESDLNASFGAPLDTYEARRAKEILKEIDPEDVVVDFHTTSAITTPFAIVVDESMIPLAQKTGLGHAVIMKHNIKQGHALINHRNGISIEAGQHDDKQSYETTLKIVENIKADKTHMMKIYEVYERILEPGTYLNFQEHENGFVPILAGEKSYDFYGLKARRL